MAMHGNETAIEALLTLDETCALLGGITATTLRRWIREQRISVVRVGGRVFIEPTELRALIARNRSTAAQNDESPDSTGLLVTTSAGAGGDVVEV